MVSAPISKSRRVFAAHSSVELLGNAWRINPPPSAERRNEMPPGSDSENLDLYRFGISEGGATTENGDEDQLTGFLLHEPVDLRYAASPLSFYYRNYPPESPLESASGECLFDLISE
ncbi:Uncharacterized protein DBV15_02365 [Temnothorax longispinosus]|uniref:Uncharacterized protein n=1 Tax=Temnothorax longispinosus TaxID=300112 RepID=A0A4S2JSG7_9HYME|nr:Uncharacterized protein DBV15_02365 [Temnothorax longispinosus]